VASADTHVTGKVDVEVIGFPWKFETADDYRSVLPQYWNQLYYN
jgi:hypothetical protein